MSETASGENPKWTRAKNSASDIVQRALRSYTSKSLGAAESPNPAFIEMVTRDVADELFRIESGSTVLTEEIVNAIIAGIGSSDIPTEQVLKIVENLDASIRPHGDNVGLVFDAEREGALLRVSDGGVVPNNATDGRFDHCGGS